MSTHDDGGQAFPFGMKVLGMTLRDYFAAQAMAALVASGDEGAGDRIGDVPGYAYEIADAMLKARAE